MAYIASMKVPVRRIGWLGFVAPWRAPMPAPGDRVYVDSDRLIGAVYELRFPKGPPTRVTAYTEECD